MSLNQRAGSLVSSNGFPTIKIDSAMLLVGRSPECDVVVDSKKISRRHCCLALVKDKLYVRDLGSTNGCWRQGERVNDFSVGEGQEFSIGDATYRFHWDHPSDQLVLPGSKARPSVPDRREAPRAHSEPTVGRASPESSDPFVQLAGLA